MKPSFTIRMLEKLEMFLYRRTDDIFAVTHSFCKELIQRRIGGDKIDVVVNCVDPMAKWERGGYNNIMASESRWRAGWLGLRFLASNAT